MMSNNDLLQSILSFHQRLADPAFTERVMRRIERSHAVRQYILTGSLCLGFLAVFAGLNWLMPVSWETLIADVPYPALFISSVVVVSFVFFTWIFNEEFDRP
ncbi:MAG: hypothetical protein V2I33_09930 [Kangiellaceae bacterium]|jgi:hypothetical protein|nr:hypothetical protein [Kangiellaceae bacterium]